MFSGLLIKLVIVAINGIRCSRIDYKIPNFHLDHPSFEAQCQVKNDQNKQKVKICEAPFALLSHYNGHSCSSPFEQLTDRDIYLTNQ